MRSLNRKETELRPYWLASTSGDLPSLELPRDMAEASLLASSRRKPPLDAPVEVKPQEMKQGRVPLLHRRVIFCLKPRIRRRCTTRLIAPGLMRSAAALQRRTKPLAR